MEVPAPVELGEPTSDDPLVEQLHRATLANRVRRIRRCLVRGCSPDAANKVGQTPLFAAALASRRAAADELLRRGANPNARCDGGYTAVHAACFSGRCGLLRRLLESGGDLRLYDLAGRRPMDWARLQPDPLRRRRVLQLIESARLAAMTSSGRDALIEKNTSFSGAAGSGGGGVRQLLRRLLPGDTPRRRAAAAAAADQVDMADLVRSVQSVGFGAVYYGAGEARPAALAVLPMVSERGLEPDRTVRGFPLGGYTEMAARLYMGTAVSVRRLMERPPKGAQPDLLIGELEAARQLHHPSLLLLMAVCPSENLDALALVFERVSLGSLYHCRYTRNMSLSAASAAQLLLTVCSALQFMHAAGWLHCAVTSHAVQLVAPGRAKLGCLEHAVQVPADGTLRPQRRLLACCADGALYNWLAPEVLTDMVPSEVSDVYSLCALTWEMVYGRPPWDGLSAQQVCKQAAVGRRLPLSKDACPPLLRHLLEVGLRGEPQRRDLQLDEVAFMLTTYRDSIGEQAARPAPPQTAAPAAQAPLAKPECVVSRPATPGSSTSLRRSTKKNPAPAPPVRLSRTLSPDALAPVQPSTRRPQPMVRASWERQTTGTSARARTAALEEDPFTGLRRTASGRQHRRSATWQSGVSTVLSPPGVCTDQEVAIKPASHRLTRHGSSCSINRAAAGGGAPPWPPAPADARRPGRRLHSVSLDGAQAPRQPQFSPSPPGGSTSLSQLMAELDVCPLPHQQRLSLPRVLPDLRGPAPVTGHQQRLSPPRVLPDLRGPAPVTGQQEGLDAARRRRGHSSDTARRSAPAGQTPLRYCGHSRAQPQTPVCSADGGAQAAEVYTVAPRGREAHQYPTVTVGNIAQPQIATCSLQKQAAAGGGAVPRRAGAASVPPVGSAPPLWRGRADGRSTRSLGRPGPPGPPVTGGSGMSRAAGRWSMRETHVQTNSTRRAEASSQTAAGTTDERGSQTSDAHGTTNGFHTMPAHTHTATKSSSSSSATKSSSSSNGFTHSAYMNGHASSSAINGRLNYTNGPAASAQFKEPARGATGERSIISGGRQAASSVSTGSPAAENGGAGSTPTSVGSSCSSGQAGASSAPDSEVPMADYSRSSFAARRQFFDGGGSVETGTVYSVSEPALRLPQRLNTALLLNRAPASADGPAPQCPAPAHPSPPAEPSPQDERRRLLLTQPRPFQPPQQLGRSGQGGSVTYPVFRRSLATETGRDRESSSPHSGQQGTQSVEMESSSTSARTPPAGAATSTPQRPRTVAPPAAVGAVGASTTANSCAMPPNRLNVTFHAQVLEFSAGEEAVSVPDEPSADEADWPPPPPPHDVDPDDAEYYDDDLASPDVEQAHLQLQSTVSPPPEEDLSAVELPTPLLQCLDDGARASPLSMELPSSGADGESDSESELPSPRQPPLRALQADVQSERVGDGRSVSADRLPGGGGRRQLQHRSLSEAHLWPGAGAPALSSAARRAPDGSQVRLFELRCRAGFSASVETRAAADGRCTVTCTSTDLRDGSETRCRRTVTADQVQTQIVVADR